MIDWLAKRNSCRECRGTGYIYGEYCHNLTGPGTYNPLYVMRCPSCQPQTFSEMEEAVQQESAKC